MDRDGLLKQPFRPSRECLANMPLLFQVSKHGERDDDEGIVYKPVHEIGFARIDMI